MKKFILVVGLLLSMSVSAAGFTGAMKWQDGGRICFDYGYNVYGYDNLHLSIDACTGSMPVMDYLACVGLLADNTGVNQVSNPRNDPAATHPYWHALCKGQQYWVVDSEGGTITEQPLLKRQKASDGTESYADSGEVVDVGRRCTGPALDDATVTAPALLRVVDPYWDRDFYYANCRPVTSSELDTLLADNVWPDSEIVAAPPAPAPSPTPAPGTPGETALQYAWVVSSINDGGKPWHNLLDADGAPDDAGAYAELFWGETTNTLSATNFSFPLPAGATVTGIEVVIRAKFNKPNQAYDFSVQLTTGGDNKARPSSVKWDTLYADIVYGGPGDTWNSNIPDAAAVNDLLFGVLMKFRQDGSVSGFYVDSVGMKIYFSE